MKKSSLHLAAMLCATLLLTACFGPKTPQEVAQAFWQAILTNNTKDAVKYSTLDDAKDFDAFSKNWNGFEVTWGRVIIEGNQASIESNFTKQKDADKIQRNFITYLVRRDDVWKVDYERTRSQVRGSIFSTLLGKISQLTDEISQQLSYSTREFNAHVDHMTNELERLSESLGKQASENIEKYGEALRKRIEELQHSIERALEEQQDNLSDEDKRVMNQVVSDLEADSDKLDDPDTGSIVASSKSVGQAQQQLDGIDNQAMNKYKKQWQEWRKQFEEDMTAMINELSSLSEKPQH